MATRLVDIYFVKLRRRVAYVVAYCHRDAAARTFRVDRIDSLQLLDSHFLVDEKVADEALTYFPFTTVFPPFLS